MKHAKLILVLACLSTISTKAYARTIPDPTTWTISPVASRDAEGGIIITAKTTIPDGVNLWVQIGQNTSKVTVAAGQFSSEPFKNKDKAFPIGSHKVSFMAYFNGAWQQPPDVVEV